YVPAGCLTVTNDTASQTVTYAFNGCSGPYGLLNVTGTIKVTYASPSATQLVLTFSAAGLKVNRATVDWTAKADIVANAARRRDMPGGASLNGVTARGRTFSRKNEKSLRWTVGGQCIEVNGSSDGTVGDRGVHTDVINYSRCRGECPAAGSEIRVTNTTN